MRDRGGMAIDDLSHEARTSADLSRPMFLLHETDHRSPSLRDHASGKAEDKRRGIQPGRLNRYFTMRGGMLKALAISSSSFGSPARIDASLLLRTFASHSGSTTTARPTATRSAPILIAPSASSHVLIPPLAMTALRPAITRANSVIGLSAGI